MNLIATQQAALDNALVPSEKRLKIERYNARIAFSKPQKEETYQVTLDALKCIFGKSTGLYRLRESHAQMLLAMYYQKNVDYVALLWEDFMYQADNREISSAKKGHMPYPRFTKVIIDHFISKDNTISMRNMINLHTVRDDTLLEYKTYLDYANGKVPPKKVRKFKKPASPKLKTVHASPKEPTQKGKRVKRAAKKATTTLTAGVVIRDTPDKSANGSSEGADFESKVLDEQTDKAKDTNKGTGEKQRVPDVSKDDSTDSKADSWGDNEDESDNVHDEDDNDDDHGNDDNSGNDDDGGNDDSGNEDDYEENHLFTLEDYEEEEQDEEYMYTQEKDKSDDEENMFDEEDDDIAKELYGDLNIIQGLRETDMTNAEQGREDQHKASQESGFVQEEGNGHVTLTTVYDKTEGTTQTSSVSSDFTRKLLNLDNTGLDVNKIASLMNASTVPPPPPLKLKCMSSTKQVNLLKLNSLIPGIVDNYLASKIKKEVNVVVRLQSTKLKEEAKAENKDFVNQVESTMKQIIKEQVKAQVSKIMPQIEKGRDDQDKDEEPFTGLDRGTKRRKSSKDAEPSKGSKSKDSKSFSSSKGTQSQHKSFDKSTQAEEPEFEADTKIHQDQGNKSGHIDDQPDNEAAPKHDWFQKHDKPLTPNSGWKKSKSLTLDRLRNGSAPLPKNVTKKNNLLAQAREYPFDLSKPLPFIEDQGRQVVTTAYFIKNDLEYLKDMLLLLVQKKLFNLDVDDRYDLGVALRMLTRHIVILHRVKDLQLGVESYQKKLNIARPETTRSNISKLTPYTTYKNP
nr:hypothetical protein [Tanacetum cinerariifolium]